MALPGQSAWVYRTGESDPANVQAFGIAAGKFGNDAGDGLGGVTLMMAPVKTAAGEEILLVAFPTHKPHISFDIAAEEVLDASCGSVAE